MITCMTTRMSDSPSIYYYRCADIPEFCTAELSQFLDPEEMARFQRMRDFVGARFAQARRMVKSLLAERTGIATEALRFRYTDNGKPHIVAADQHWCFSISHCDSGVAVAVSKHDLGVDLEVVDRARGKISPPWQHPENFMHPTTAALVKTVPREAQAERFAHLWTLMESQVKLCDSSIFHASKKLQLQLLGQAPQWHASVIGESCCFWSWRLAGGESLLSLAVAKLESQPVPVVYQWHVGGEHSVLDNIELITVPADC